jgi:hypothetical protein
MQPLKHDGQDVVYDNGVPVTLSRMRQSDVIVAPVTGPTGRYKIEDRVAFLGLVRNRSAERIEVSEANFKLTASGAYARTITAAEMEDKIRSEAAWAHAANAFSAVVASFDAALTAGRTTAVVESGGQKASVEVSDNGEWRARREVARESAYVDVRDHGEARRAQREVVRDYAQASAAVATREQYDLANLRRMLQRNTVEPNSEVGGIVVMNVPRDYACATAGSAGTGAMGVRGEAIPCHFTFAAEVAGETHKIRFDEAFSGP